MNVGTSTPARDPGSVNELRRRITAAAAARSSTVKRLQSLIVNVTLAQMLPPAAVQGGTGLKLRLGDAMTRQTPTSTPPSAAIGPHSSPT